MAKLPVGWGIEQEKPDSLKKAKNDFASKVNGRGISEREKVFEISRAGSGYSVSIYLEPIDARLRYVVYKETHYKEQVGEPFSSFKNAKERAYTAAHDMNPDREIKAEQGYVWNVEETGGVTAEEHEYNLKLSDSPVEYEPVFSGTFDNRNLEAIEGSSAYTDLEEIANQGLRIKVKFIETKEKGGYNYIISYEVLE